MKHFNVLLCVMLATASQFCCGITNFCQRLCCSSATNQTDLNLQNKNNTNCTKECFQPQGTDTNITLQQLCSKQNYTKTNKELSSTSNFLTMDIDCQETYDSASNNFVGLVKRIQVNFHRLQGFWYINLTWDALNDPKISKNWSHYIVQWITLENPLHQECTLVSKNQTFLVINSTEDVWQYPQVIELNVSTYPLKKDTGYGFNVRGLPLLATPGIPATLPTTASLEVVAISIVGSFAGLLLVIILIFVWKFQLVREVWYRYFDRWKTKPRRRSPGQFEFDTSILYSTEDEAWVTKELIPFLETENSFKCFVHFRDFQPGIPLNENMADAVYNCRKNIVVVSRNFLKSNFCRDELDMALDRVQRCRDSSLIVVNLDGVPIEELPKALRIRTFVNLRSSLERNTWRNRLVRQISTEDENARPGGPRQVISHDNEFSTSSVERDQNQNMGESNGLSVVIEHQSGV